MTLRRRAIGNRVSAWRKDLRDASDTLCGQTTRAGLDRSAEPFLRIGGTVGCANQRVVKAQPLDLTLGPASAICSLTAASVSYADT